MSRDRNSDHLDEAIDRVAESLTAGEPSAMLRASVRSRIDDSRTNPHTIRWRAAVTMAALVVLAALALAQVLLDDRSPTEIAANPQPKTGSGSLPPVEVSSGRVDDAPRSETVPGPRSPDGAGNGSATAAIGPGFQTAPPDEPADPPFPPLSVDQVAIEPLAAIPVAIEDVSVPIPLQVQRLEVVALAME